MAEVQLSAQGSVIKTAYEAEADTNAYNDAAVTKLAGIVPGVATTNVFKIPGSLARGDIFFIDVSGNLVRLPAGTNGHFLKTQSTTGDPVWEALPGGGDMLKATYDPDADGIFAIAQGGTGQATAQAAIDAISQVAGATNEHVLTKDTGTGNATWKVGGGGGVTDHGALTGLADDDHTQYLPVNGTRAMTGDLNMDNNDVINILRLFSNSDTDGLILYGGDTAVAGSIAVYGKNHATVPGLISLEVPDAAKAGTKWALRVYGVSDTPKVDIAFGLDMNSKKIENLLAGSAAADAVRYDQVMLLSGANAMAGDLDMAGLYDIKDMPILSGAALGITIQAKLGNESTVYLKSSDHPSSPGNIEFWAVNAALSGLISAGYFEGATNSPQLHIKYGLDMHSKKIESLLAGSAAADAVRYDQVMLRDGSQAMAGNLNMGDYLIDDVDDIQAYDTGGIAVRNSTATSKIMLATSTYAFMANANATMSNLYKIVNHVDPSAAQDVSTKNYADKHIGGAAATELTIATGAVTITQSYHTIDTEGDIASDPLDTINGGTEGQSLTIKAENGARTVTVTNAIGNLRLSADMALDNVDDTITMIYDGTNWTETARSNNGT